jgi:acetolactate synthase-1/2/3 large subunit
MIKVSDYIVKTLVSQGIEDLFMITGGGAMHLNDSFGRCTALKYYCNHHEQAAAIAAESYARLTGKIAAVCVTSGPGGTNAITGVLGGWLDSIPMLVISGQVRFDTTVHSTGLPLRQLGDQEFDIVRCVNSMTKYAVMVTEPLEIRYHLERALFLARNGRPGPCWLDIPLNVQGALVDESDLEPYDPAEDNLVQTIPLVLPDKAKEILRYIADAKRPVLLAGSGIRLAGAHDDFLKLIDYLNIPVVTAWNAHDNLHDDHPLYCGRPGTVGDRAGNFAVQNADLLLVLGCRLNIRQISYNWKAFAREAFKIVVDIDSSELQKPTIKVDYPVHADVGEFISALLTELSTGSLPARDEWLNWLTMRRKRYPVVLEEYWQKKSPVNPYCFVHVLSRLLPENQVTVTGDGTACVCTFQAAIIKKGQRLFTNSGCASMGYDLPAAIGACIGSGKRKTVCLAGDGSIQMNIQELQTIFHYQLPVKVFYLNNNGYHSIRQTQSGFFGLPFVGCGPESGVSFPDVERMASAYMLPFFRCSDNESLESVLSAVLADDSPAICEIMLDPDQPFAPKTSSFRLPNGKIVSKPLEDLAPFLDREEFIENMIVQPMPEES